MGKILKNHTFRYYTMICNYLIINYMYNKNHIPILYTEVLDTVPNSVSGEG